jgi:predicted Zn-dependent protease
LNLAALKFILSQTIFLQAQALADKGLDMPTLEMVVINRDTVYAEEMADVFEMVQDRFPSKHLYGIEVLGKVEVKHDTKVLIRGKEYKAHEYANLMRKMKKFKEFLGVKGPFLGLAYDPMVRIYTEITARGVETGIEVLRDYVHENTVVYSCFGVPVNKNFDSALHTLGHVAGLRHHVEPIDIMYYNLLQEQTKLKTLDSSGKYFCEVCEENLKRQ